jgi:Tol biopolymer transport system component
MIRWMVAVCIVALISVPFGSMPPALAVHPGNNGMIAFARTVNGYRHLFVIASDGTGEQQLTSARADDGSPDWSPDGTKIAFARDDPNRGLHKIMVLTVATGMLINISGTDANYLNPSWGPGGGRMMFDRNQEIWVMHADGSGKQRIIHSTQRDYDPSWSSRGVAFVRCCSVGWNSSIYVQFGGGTATRQFIGAPGYGDGTPSVSGPDWSPDGALLAFQDSSLTSDGPDAHIAWTNGRSGAEFDGDQAFCVHACLAFDPAWAPDGAFVAYRLIPDDGVHEEGLYTLPVCLVPCNAVPTFLTSGFEPAWQPLPIG